MISSQHSKTPVSFHKLPDSLKSVALALEKDTDFKPSRVIKILKAAQIQEDDLMPWAKFDHPASDSYGRRLVYQGGHFEIMVMSWKPGDFSAIHDHGYTQWGAVQIFGPAEHATFRVEDGQITTLARWTVEPGEIIGVGHSLVHQMGNPTDDRRFLSLHVYGDLAHIDNVTGDARVFDLQHNTIQRVDGGVFFALQEQAVKRTEEGPEPDFPTRLRHMVEYIKRLRRMSGEPSAALETTLQHAIDDAFSSRHREKFLLWLSRHTDTSGHQTHSTYWRSLNIELKAAARLQQHLKNSTLNPDAFFRYAELYDALIGNPCLNDFIAPYFRFAIDKYPLQLHHADIISLGCGTALIAEHLIKMHGARHEHVYGIDISPSMVEMARRRIKADVGDVLTLDPAMGMWDVAISTLNVLHYIDHNRLEEAIQRSAAIIKPGGYFIGDFITPDHIRWYPNVVTSRDQDVISLRTPELIEDGGLMFQQSDIVNMDLRGPQIEITHAGKHRRFLPPLHRVRTYFENAFKGAVDFYDAVDLDPIPGHADSCKSTRYLVIARKQGVTQQV